MYTPWVVVVSALLTTVVLVIVIRREQKRTGFMLTVEVLTAFAFVTFVMSIALVALILTDSL